MNSTTPELSDAPPQRVPPSPDLASWGKLLRATAPLIGAPAFFGPPVVFVLGPWLLLALLLIGPFALILAGLLAFAIVAGLLAGAIAVIASPYLLIRHLRAHRLVHAKPRAALHVFRKSRVSAGRLGSLQTKGTS